MLSALCIIIITLFLPPLGVLIVSGCGADFCINLLLTLLGFFPGHIHAFYIEYIYYKRKGDAGNGVYDSRPAPGVFSDRVNFPRGHVAVGPDPAYAPLHQGYPQPQPVYQHAGAQPDTNYGTAAPLPPSAQSAAPAEPPAYTKK